VQDTRTSRATWAILAIAVLAVVALVVAVAVLVMGTEGDDRDDAPDSAAVVDPTAAPVEPAVSSVAPDDPVSPAEFGTGECPPLDRSGPPVRTFTDAPRQCIDTSQEHRAVVETNHGSFTITLDTDNSPVTVNNFVTLARWGYYDRTGCHRVVADFVVQCGRPGTNERAPGYSIPDELPTTGAYDLGVVAMANAGAPDSGGGQWFIISGPDGSRLPPQYSIVGRVTEGFGTTVRDLAALADPTAPEGVPTLEPIRIRSVRITVD
jgi:cyclophilin family peptidyl-prolyl cis-trans isomerase